VTTTTCSSPCSRKSSTYLDTAGEAPVDLTLTGTVGGIDFDVAMVDAGTLAQVGAVPKVLSLDKRRFSYGQEGWRCQPSGTTMSHVTPLDTLGDHSAASHLRPGRMTSFCGS